MCHYNTNDQAQTITDLVMMPSLTVRTPGEPVSGHFADGRSPTAYGGL